jgi:hypothetical protein
VTLTKKTVFGGGTLDCRAARNLVADSAIDKFHSVVRFVISLAGRFKPRGGAKRAEGSLGAVSHR